MSENIFIAPRLTGKRFEDSSLPVDILDDFRALEELIIEIAKGLYLEENTIRQRVPKGFSDGVYLKLVSIEDGSSIPMFALSTMMSFSSGLPFEEVNFSYFHRAKDKVIQIIANANSDSEISHDNHKYISYFNKIGRNLLDDESIDFGYNFEKSESSSAILNKKTRKRIILSSQQREYSAEFRLFALVPAIDLDKKTFSIETEYGKKECQLTENITDKVLTAVQEYNNKSYVSIQGNALFNSSDRLIKIQEITSFDILDPLDVSFRIHQLQQLKNGWYNGLGTELNKETLNVFANHFNSFYGSKLPLPAIFPTVEGNIQLEWKNNTRNLIATVNMETLHANFFYFDSDSDEEKEDNFDLSQREDWSFVNLFIINNL